MGERPCLNCGAMLDTYGNCHTPFCLYNPATEGQEYEKYYDPDGDLTGDGWPGEDVEVPESRGEAEDGEDGPDEQERDEQRPDGEGEDKERERDEQNRGNQDGDVEDKNAENSTDDPQDAEGEGDEDAPDGDEGDQDDEEDSESDEKTCPECNGEHGDGDNPCPECGGSGKVPNDDENEGDDDQEDDGGDQQERKRPPMTKAQRKRFKNIAARIFKKTEETFGKTNEHSEVKGMIEDLIESGDLSQEIEIKSRGVSYRVIVYAIRDDR